MFSWRYSSLVSEETQRTRAQKNSPELSPEGVVVDFCLWLGYVLAFAGMKPA